jgi:small nuclear ribonucleoprotein
MEASRPLDALNRARDKKVIVELKNNKQYLGTLRAFDIHINVVLENAEEHVEEFVEKEIDGKKVSARTGHLVMKRKLGVVFIRGDTITVISPE